jgi:hypothetical protein
MFSNRIDTDGIIDLNTGQIILHSKLTMNNIQYVVIEEIIHFNHDNDKHDKNFWRDFFRACKELELTVPRCYMNKRNRKLYHE